MTGLISMAYSTPPLLSGIPGPKKNIEYSTGYHRIGSVKGRVCKALVAATILHILVQTRGELRDFSPSSLNLGEIALSTIDGLLVHRIYALETDHSNRDALKKIQGGSSLLLLGLIHGAIAVTPPLPSLRSWLLP